MTNSSPRAKAPLREFLKGEGLPPGLLESVLQSYESLDSRLWLLDNSSAMKVCDSHLARQTKIGSNVGVIERLDNVSRWEELYQCVSFHAKMASKAWIPTMYWLVNNEGNGNHKFSLCWSSYEDVHDELSHIKRVLKDVSLDHRECPLGERLHSLGKGIKKEAANLEARDRQVTLVICTQGLPTDSHGCTSSKLRRDFQYELAKLGKLPVKIIIRLTTDDERVKDMFNTMDSKFESIDVLDDYWGEAMEVYLHNPWLTYGIGLHRLRETGLAPEVMDDLDESLFSLDDLYEFCHVMFIGDDDLMKLPHPKDNWNAFMRAVAVLVEKEPKQWNPIKKKMTHWINLEKLDKVHGDKNERCSLLDHREMARAAPRAHPPRRKNTFRRMASHPPEEYKRKPSNGSAATAPEAYKRSPSNVSAATDDAPPLLHRKRNAVNKGAPAYERSSSSCDLTLEQVIQRWSHQPSDYKRYHSLQHLLVTVPDTFPPTNSKVETHEYFAKWKTLDSGAFEDVSGDELDELLKRAVKKAKFFLHPDKLPKDLTDNQTLLFKTIWYVLQDREAAMLG